MPLKPLPYRQVKRKLEKGVQKMGCQRGMCWPQGGSEGFYIKLGARYNEHGWLVWDNFLELLN